MSCSLENELTSTEEVVSIFTLPCRKYLRSCSLVVVGIISGLPCRKYLLSHSLDNKQTSI